MSDVYSVPLITGGAHMLVDPTYCEGMLYASHIGDNLSSYRGGPLCRPIGGAHPSFESPAGNLISSPRQGTISR